MNVGFMLREVAISVLYCFYGGGGNIGGSGRAAQEGGAALCTAGGDASRRGVDLK